MYSVAGATLKPTAKLKSLGVIPDSWLNFTDHVSARRATITYGHWDTFVICWFKTLQTLACSIKGARLDYCNSPFYEALTSTVVKLQRLLNLMAQMVMQQPRRTHAKPLIHSLLWLSIKHRITYISCAHLQNMSYVIAAIFEFFTITSQAPEWHLGLHRVRSSPFQRTVCVCASVIWNSSPTDLHFCDSFISFMTRLIFVDSWWPSS